MNTLIYFSLGFFIYSIVLVLPFLKERPKAIGWIGICLGISFGSLFLAHYYDMQKFSPPYLSFIELLPEALIAYLLFFSIGFIKQLLSPINKQRILQTGLTGVYVILVSHVFPISWTIPLLIIIVVPALYNLYVCFIPQQVSLLAKVVFYGYYLFLNILLIAAFLSFPNLGNILRNNLTSQSKLEIFFMGATSFYLTSQLFYLYALFMVPLKTRSYVERMEVFQWFAEKYTDEQLSKLYTFIMAIIQSLLLLGNYFFSWIPHTTMITLSTVIPIVITTYTKKIDPIIIEK